MKMKALCIISVMMLSIPAMAAKINVNTIGALQQAIKNAVPGDEIILANGTYTTEADITIACTGTAAKHITIRAASPLGAEITGNGGFMLISPATCVDITGFKFTHRANHTKTAPGTSFCRFTRNLFETTGDGEYLMLAGSDHQVDYNTFQHKNSMGRFIAIRGQGSQIAERIWIHHNYFNDFKPQTGNGAEALQFGLSGFSMSTSNSIVEHNLFEACAGENELISVKSSGVTLRYNTVRNSKAQFTLRHGNYCQVYGNYFFQTPGLRIFGDHHLVYSNYFKDCQTAITIGNGDGEVATGSLLTCHDRPDSVYIGFNTLINNKSNIELPERKNGLGATYVTVAYNIIQGGNAAALIKGTYPGAVWTSNYIYQTAGAGDMPAGTYQEVNPKLQQNKQGIWHLTKGSPAAAASKAAITGIGWDMDGQPRTTPLDAGADQLSPARITARALNAAETGCFAK
ncbi:polysaccharide lyase 6 family protein [Chitinophaga sp. sic0106]|uniref:polysaccharide lyase 6 family protein n=1 Tax=Chitinophaga sp. sic0106 TaxID=2854785 RepID=UPI001C44F491|nr:polysaccharide lyase 6 family protein [Chitinophaga sp. sic0106]MBV7529120.1 polysaccharide lyase 6 family protein [Chitinophaga sp. sic0106]